VAEQTRPQRLLGTQDRNLWFWVFVGPFFLGLLTFVYVPIVWSVWLSFYDARNTVTTTTFVGFGNYADMLSDPAFRSSMVTFLVVAAFIVPTTFALSLGLALLVHRARWFQPFFRSVFFLPTACSYVVASLVWKMSIFSGVRLAWPTRCSMAAGHRAGPERVDRADRPVDLPHPADQQPAPAVRGRLDLDPAAAGYVPCPPAVDRPGVERSGINE
jgi:hypothetical protein